MTKLNIGSLPFLVLGIVLLTSCKENKKVTVSEPERVVQNFFDAYKNDGPREALQRLLATNKYITDGE